MPIANYNQGYRTYHAGDSSNAGNKQIHIAIEDTRTPLTALHNLWRWRVAILGECNEAELGLRHARHIVRFHAQLIER